MFVTMSHRRVFVNLEMAEKIYSKKGQHMCPNDGYVAFRNSEHICGRIGKVRGNIVSTTGIRYRC
jgi:DNA-directed RNA polymerase III subunit RPC1